MQRRSVLLLCVSIAVAGCARRGSGLNPFRWFGRSRQTRASRRNARTPLVDPARLGAAADDRPLIAQIESLQVDRTPGGAIVTATGIAETQEFFEAELVRGEIDNGALTYDFRVKRPVTPAAVGTVSSRRITAAANLTTRDLEGIRSITVRGALNAQTSSR